MPDDRNMSAAEYRGTVLSELRGIREKQDELCVRVGNVETEIIGDVADPERPTIRGRLTALEQAVENDTKRRREHERRKRARRKWIAGLLSGGLLIAIGSGWESIKKKLFGG